MNDDVARLICGNVDDLRSMLRNETDRALVTRALHEARTLREGKTKVAMLEAHLRRLPLPTIQPMPSKKTTALISLVDPQISTSGGIIRLQEVAIQQLALIDQLHRDAALRAILVGFALHRIKAGLKHGEWMPWQKANLETAKKSQVNYYMRLAAAFAEDSRLTKPELLALPVDSTELALDTMDAAARKFMEKAQKFVGTKSLNELLDEHGIKDVKKIGGARAKGDGGEATPTDPEQLYLFARDEIGGVIATAEQLLIKENRLQFLVGHPDEIRGVVESLRTLADKVEAAAKPILKK